MALFDDVLLTVDFDRTFTGPDSKIPQRNLDAVQFFMDNGGHFTVNTGRSISTFGKYLNSIPHNAPLLMYNGSACYDNGQLVDLMELDMDLWETIDRVSEEFPHMNIEIQAVDYHYLVNPTEAFERFYQVLGWPYKIAHRGDDLGPFLKFALVGDPRTNSVATLYATSEEDFSAFARAETRIHELWGDKVVTYLAAPRILDVHAKGVSKAAAARKLQAKLGKKILVCVGDAENDVPMLDGADYGFCPADAVVADRYPNVCNCGEGAVADVIYKKIPEILGFRLDK